MRQSPLLSKLFERRGGRATISLLCKKVSPGRGGQIIELDGDPHGEYHKISEDIKRDEYLQDLGFTVLRFENRFVFQDTEYTTTPARNKVITKQILTSRATPPFEKEGKISEFNLYLINILKLKFIIPIIQSQIIKLS